MPKPPSPETLDTFRVLAEIVYSAESHDAIHDAIAHSAVSLVDGCDHASLVLRRRAADIVTVGASDDVARAVDGLERKYGEGPCIDAVDESEPDEHFASDLTRSEQWPTLTRHILSETPVRGMAGFRINQEGQRIGALNVFSDTPGALTEESLHQMALLVAFATVALTAAHSGQEAATLRHGLESNREIGKAVGLLMAMHKIDDNRAFEMLAKVSQEMNIKLADVAAQVVRHHSSGS